MPCCQIHKKALEVEEKFSFYAAKEVLDVWTTIWAGRHQNTAFMAYWLTDSLNDRLTERTNKRINEWMTYRPTHC